MVDRAAVLSAKDEIAILTVVKSLSLSVQFQRLHGQAPEERSTAGAMHLGWREEPAIAQPLERRAHVYPAAL
jgi:hypothetical protein